MCDTMVALGNASSDGQVYIAKNSDRQPNEPHILVYIPRKQYRAGEKLKCTYIEIEQTQETYAVFLLKPSWIWGCEMGANEFGLNIGNEAVFTREKYAKTGLTGMDMIRLALERCRNSSEALNYLIELLEQYGQGGNCGFEKPFFYHNSFLIADPDQACILETAGQYWAVKQVTDVDSISNGLTIGHYFDKCHPHLIEHAIQKRWCKSEKNFDFANCYKDKLFTFFSGSKQRRELCLNELNRQKGSINIQTMISILRSHSPEISAKPFANASVRSVCMHAGGLIGDHTTGSYVASLDANNCTYWVTGASTPCLAAFKPLWLIENNPVLFSEEQERNALAYWYKRERLHRMVLNGQIINLDEYIDNRNQMENQWIMAASQLVSAQEKQSFMIRAWQEEENLIDKFIRSNECRPVCPKGKLYYRKYWSRQTARLESAAEYPAGK